MDPHTGEFVAGLTEKKARKRGLVWITVEEREILETMSLEERKAWAEFRLGVDRVARTQLNAGPNRHERRSQDAQDRKRVRRVEKKRDSGSRN